MEVLLEKAVLLAVAAALGAALLWKACALALLLAADTRRIPARLKKRLPNARLRHARAVVAARRLWGLATQGVLTTVAGLLSLARLGSVPGERHARSRRSGHRGVRAGRATHSDKVRRNQAPSETGNGAAHGRAPDEELSTVRSFAAEAPPGPRPAAPEATEEKSGTDVSVKARRKRAKGRRSAGYTILQATETSNADTPATARSGRSVVSKSLEQERAHKTRSHGARRRKTGAALWSSETDAEAPQGGAALREDLAACKSSASTVKDDSTQPSTLDVTAASSAPEDRRGNCVDVADVENQRSAPIAEGADCGSEAEEGALSAGIVASPVSKHIRAVRAQATRVLLTSGAVVESGSGAVVVDPAEEAALQVSGGPADERPRAQSRQGPQVQQRGGRAGGAHGAPVAATAAPWHAGRGPVDGREQGGAGGPGHGRGNGQQHRGGGVAGSHGRSRGDADRGHDRGGRAVRGGRRERAPEHVRRSDGHSAQLEDFNPYLAIPSDEGDTSDPELGPEQAVTELLQMRRSEWPALAGIPPPMPPVGPPQLLPFTPPGFFPLPPPPVPRSPRGPPHHATLSRNVRASREHDRGRRVSSPAASGRTHHRRSPPVVAIVPATAPQQPRTAPDAPMALASIDDPSLVLSFDTESEPASPWHVSPASFVRRAYRTPPSIRQSPGGLRRQASDQFGRRGSFAADSPLRSPAVRWARCVVHNARQAHGAPGVGESATHMQRLPTIDRPSPSARRKLALTPDAPPFVPGRQAHDAPLHHPPLNGTGLPGPATPPHGASELRIRPWGSPDGDGDRDEVSPVFVLQDLIRRSAVPGLRLLASPEDVEIEHAEEMLARALSGAVEAAAVQGRGRPRRASDQSVGGAGVSPMQAHCLHELSRMSGLESLEASRLRHMVAQQAMDIVDDADAPGQGQGGALNSESDGRCE